MIFSKPFSKIMIYSKLFSKIMIILKPFTKIMIFSKPFSKIMIFLKPFSDSNRITVCLSLPQRRWLLGASVSRLNYSFGLTTLTSHLNIFNIWSTLFNQFPMWIGVDQWYHCHASLSNSLAPTSERSPLNHHWPISLLCGFTTEMLLRVVPSLSSLA